MALVNGRSLHCTDMKKFLKIFFSETTGQILKIISQECFLGYPFQKLSAKFLTVHTHGSGEWGLLALNGHKEILVNSPLKATKKKWLWSAKKFR